jgi:hypothetical protein
MYYPFLFCEEVIRAGTPATKQLEDISLLTTEPAPMITLSPIATFANILTSEPTKQSFPSHITGD